MNARCAWAVNSGDGVCPRDATAGLPRSRPCGCPLVSIPSCGGHGEALAGDQAPHESVCGRCGATNRIVIGWPDARVAP